MKKFLINWLKAVGLCGGLAGFIGVFYFAATYLPAWVIPAIVVFIFTIILASAVTWGSNPGEDL